FYTAIQDDCIRKNPFDFQLNTVLEDDTEPKEPLSPTQEAAFLSFVQHDKVYQKYYDEIIILLGTGLRISELCGLTEADIDL
ncbi:site-specific integrase, partial [Clostridioides difficile]|nr:site-specific integrase [Clostridioides difficile]